MFFRGSKIFLIIVTILLIAACDDYKGMDEVTIIAGIAIDEDESNPEAYSIMAEIVDAKSKDQSGTGKAYRIYSNGENIAEAINNMSRKLQNKLSFSHVEVLVVGQKIAEKKGLHDIIDSFLRDTGIRENMNIIISCGQPASEILTPPEGEKKIVSFEINKSLARSRGEVNADGAKMMELYQIYNTLKTGASDLTLASISVDETESKSLFINGLVVFKEDKMVDLIQYPEAKYIIIADVNIGKGTYTLKSEDSNENDPFFLSLTIKKSAPSKSFEFDGEKFKLKIRLEIIASAVDFSSNWPKLDFEVMSQTELWANELLSKDIEKALTETRDKTGSDIIGFAGNVKRNDTKLWEKISEDWQEYYNNAEFDVTCDIYIEDTGLIENY